LYCIVLYVVLHKKLCIFLDCCLIIWPNQQSQLCTSSG